MRNRRGSLVNYTFFFCSSLPHLIADNKINSGYLVKEGGVDPELFVGNDQNRPKRRSVEGIQSFDGFFFFGTLL